MIAHEHYTKNHMPTRHVSDQQIDALVYELYGLTPEETKLVEGGK